MFSSHPTSALKGIIRDRQHVAKYITALQLEYEVIYWATERVPRTYFWVHMHAWRKNEPTYSVIFSFIVGIRFSYCNFNPADCLHPLGSKSPEKLSTFHKRLLILPRFIAKKVQFLMFAPPPPGKKSIHQLCP